MIASLRGTVLSLDGHSIVVDVHGVGYSVQVAKPQNWKINEEIFIHIATVIREDAFILFGFASPEEHSTFEILRTVSGVGPKSAQAILASMSIDEIAQAVSLNNDAAFKAVSGIGPKTAKLICVSLAGKFASVAPNANIKAVSSASAEVLDALMSLGWNEKTARDAVMQITKDTSESISEGELLKLALARLGKAKSIGVSDE
ncbi:MAG: Holliday junction branch migration protein RuvA [Rhodoluna sp.]